MMLYNSIPDQAHRDLVDDLQDRPFHATCQVCGCSTYDPDDGEYDGDCYTCHDCLQAIEEGGL